MYVMFQNPMAIKGIIVKFVVNKNVDIFYKWIIYSIYYSNMEVSEFERSKVSNLHDHPNITIYINWNISSTFS